MPKIVNHEEQQQKIAAGAAELFSRYGYSALGMRRIADELGMSKSALYHYFPTKQDLFVACTKVATSFPIPETSDPTAEQDPFQQLSDFINVVEPTIESELTLLLDYLRGKDNAEKSADPAMQLANQRFSEAIGQWFPDQNTTPVLCLTYGLLLLRYFDGQQTSSAELIQWLKQHL